MQYEPERFPSRDYKFIVKGNLGIVAREYEVAQLGQILQAIGDDSPLKPALIEAIIDHMNVSNREQIIAMLKESGKPNPEAEEAQKQATKIAEDFQVSQTAALNGQASESEARAVKYDVDSRATPIKLENDRLKIAATMEEDDDKDFRKRLAILDRSLKEDSINNQFNNPQGQ